MTQKVKSLSKRYAPMTAAQINFIVEEYAASFPDWVVVIEESAFVRRVGPIQQKIWFQRMAAASYRPSHIVNSLVLAKAHIRMLPQVLDVKHREVPFRMHEEKVRNTLMEMEKQFVPNVRRPIDLLEILKLCRNEADSMANSENNVAMLSILNAWLGNDAEAIQCCARMQECGSVGVAPVSEWREMIREFGRALADAVRCGSGREFLLAQISD